MVGNEQFGDDEGPLVRHIRALDGIPDCLASLALDPTSYALFLDIDGTLIDLAATPDSVIAPPELGAILARLSDKLGGALALVTGRTLVFADQLFALRQFPIAGLHGAERRDANGQITHSQTTLEFLAVKSDLLRMAKAWPGVLIEDKGAAIAAHYRAAPRYALEVEAAMGACLAGAGPGYALQHGKMVVEIRPDAANKGSAVNAFMEAAPFKGRIPVAIGDDITDEEMFRVVNQMGGASIRIVETPASTAATHRLESPAALRRALALIAA